MATKTKKPAATPATAAGKSLPRGEEFRAAMTHLAALLDSAGRLAGEVLDRHPAAVGYYHAATELTAVASVSACLADDLRSNGAAGHPG
jgi:hypothetical protein